MATADSVMRMLRPGAAQATQAVEEEHVSDSAMLEGIKAGEPEALGAIYDRYSGMVYSMLLGILRDHRAAEEVQRDLFLQLWRYAPDFDASAGSLPAWLMVFGRSRALARLQLSHDSGEELESYRRNGMASPFDMEEEAQIQTVMETMRRAMDELPREERETVELAYTQGLTESELAGRRGVSGDVVRARLLSAMNALIESYGRTRQG